MKQREFKATEVQTPKTSNDEALKKAALKAEDTLKAIDQAQQSPDQYICHCGNPTCDIGDPWMNVRTGEIVYGSKPR